MNYEFEWDFNKELENIAKHGYSFETAKEVFGDSNVIHLEDPRHSSGEDRSYAVGRCKDGVILTVRYTMRGKTIRIFGAADWRKWRKYYEKNTQSE